MHIHIHIHIQIHANLHFRIRISISIRRHIHCHTCVCTYTIAQNLASLLGLCRVTARFSVMVSDRVYVRLGLVLVLGVL